MAKSTKQMEHNQIDQPLLTVREVLGKLKISRQTLWKLTNEKEVRTVKVGGSIRYTPDQVKKLIDE